MSMQVAQFRMLLPKPGPTAWMQARSPQQRHANSLDEQGSRRSVVASYVPGACEMQGSDACCLTSLLDLGSSNNTMYA